MPDGWLAWLARGAECAGVPEIPAGWKLIVEGEIGGVHLMMPFRVCAEGGEAVVVQGSSYYVDPRWHGPASAALFLALVKLRSRYHCSVATANESSGAVWKAFRAAEITDSNAEYCLMRARLPLLEEAFVRRMPALARSLPRGAPEIRASLRTRLTAFRERLGSALSRCGEDAVEPCTRLTFPGPGTLPTPALLRWKLSAPAGLQELVLLEHNGAPCAAFFMASVRGHRGQIPTLDLAAVWGPAWEASPGPVLSHILRAARRDFPYFTLGISPLPAPARALLRRRVLTAPRRWLAPSPAQPPLIPGWNNLDAM